jgi:hypothetical protein
MTISLRMWRAVTELWRIGVTELFARFKPVQAEGQRPVANKPMAETWRGGVREWGWNGFEASASLPRVHNCGGNHQPVPPCSGVDLWQARVLAVL